MDEMIGNRDVDAGYRIRIRNRIKKLEVEIQNSLNKAEKGVRIWALVTAFIIGVAVTVAGQFLWRLISGNI